MTEENFSDLFKDTSISRHQLQPGDRIQATIASISGDNIFLDAGGKSEGILSAAEMRNADGIIDLKEGDKIVVYFLAVRKGEMIFTTSLGSGHASIKELEEAYASSIPVDGKVIKEVKGGFEIKVAGQRCFCPYSQMDIRRIENADQYIDKTLSFKIIEYGSKGKNIILSARAVLEAKRAEERDILKQTLEENMQIQGTVSSIRDFGAFVDLGGVDGLIPVSELAWGQVNNVSDILEPGQRVEVIIKKLDWDSDRISLSLKETTENPWSKVNEKFQEGTIHQGTISRLAEFGAFITLEPGVDGLLHISKLGAGRKIHHPREVLEIGQTIAVRIASVDMEKKRISLEPEDFTSDNHKEAETIHQQIQEKTPQSLGTLGDLLQTQLAGNKKR